MNAINLNIIFTIVKPIRKVDGTVKILFKLVLTSRYLKLKKPSLFIEKVEIICNFWLSQCLFFRNILVFIFYLINYLKYTWLHTLMLYNILVYLNLLSLFKWFSKGMRPQTLLINIKFAVKIFSIPLKIDVGQRLD